MLISSLDNNHIKSILKLKEKKYQDSTNTFLIEGFHLLEEALKENLVKEIILIEGTEYSSEINTIYVTSKIMKKLSDIETIPKVMAIVNKKPEKKLGNNIIILEGIQDPGNLGTIIRSAYAFNVDTIILGSNCVSLYNSKVIRSTQGMLFHINIIIRKNICEEILKLKEDNYLILGTKVDKGTDIKNVSYSGKLAIIIGNEGQGMSEEVTEICDEYLYIQMHKNCESLNAAVAGSILMYEVFNK